MIGFVRRSVGPSVRPSVRLSVGPSISNHFFQMENMAKRSLVIILDSYLEEPRPRSRPHPRPRPCPHPHPHPRPHPKSSRTHRCSSRTCLIDF